MLILLIGVILLILSIVCVKIKTKNYISRDILDIMAAASFLIGVITVGLMGIWAISAQIGASSEIAENQVIYDSLIYKVEMINNGCGDELGIRNTDIISEVQDWNSDLAFGKTASQNPWINILFPKRVYDFDFIENPKIQ